MLNKLAVASDLMHGEVSRAQRPDTQARRREQIRDMTNTSRRLKRLLIHQAVKMAPDLWEGVLSFPYNRKGYDVLGFGWHTTAINSNGQVIKIVRSSGQLDEDSKEEMLGMLRDRQGVVLDNMGEYPLEQDFDIIEHPIRPGKRVVAAKQPLVQGPRDIFTVPPGEAVGVTDKISDFITLSEAMVSKTGFAPDTSGAGNLMLVGQNQLVLVDTLPIETKFPEVKRSVQNSITVLRRLGEIGCSDD